MFKTGVKTFYLLLVMGVMITSGTLSAQTKGKLYDVRLDNVTLKEALNYVSAQCGYDFVYEDADFANTQRISKNFKQCSIDSILKGCLEGTSLTYIIDKNNVYIKASAKTQNISVPTNSKQQTTGNVVSGIVKDENGEPLPGANIIVKGEPGNGTNTDVDGKFCLKINNINKDNALIISFIGMKEQEVPIGNRQVVEVTLKEDRNVLEQIVVVGYGAVKKKDIAGSVQNVTSSQIEETNIPNFERAIQGRMSGVQITSTSGIPGSSFNIQIRGRGSINAGTEPLYIVDGVQMTNGARSTGVLTNADAMSSINPADIESITVLKDGASASIYGAQAANGVIIITTKRGSAGKTKVSFSATAGVQQLVRKVDVMDGKQWAEYALTEYKNYDAVYGTTLYEQRRAMFEGFGWGADGYSNAPTTDWYKEIFHKAVVQNYEIGIQGGNEKTRFYISGNYNDTDGIIKHTGYSRATGRVNLTHEFNKWLTINTNNTFGRNKYNQASTVASSNPSRTAMLLLPGVSPRDENGEWVRDLSYGYYTHNVPQMLELNEYTGTNWSLTSANDLTFKIIDGLTFKSSYNFDYSWMKEHQYSDPRTRLGYKSGGVVSAYATDINKFQTEQVVTYNKEFKENTLNVVGGFSYIDHKYHSISASAIGVAHPDLSLLSSASTPQTTGESFSEWKMAGFFTRVSFTLKDKYIFSATARYDGSSKFGEENKWGFFPSLSFAWRMKNENFLKNVNWLSDLKLRASYGITGNSDIGSYVSGRLYSGGHAYNGISGILASSIGNPKLSWEKKHSKNIGITAGFFDGRITIDIDAYRDDTKDLLYYRTIPQTTGFTSIPSNMGSVRNQGVDIQLNTVNIDRGNFRWNTEFNISFYKNEVTKLQDGLNQIGNYKVGKPVSSEFIYKWAGINTSDGRPMYYDKNGYITYNPTLEDRYWSKPKDPTLYGGLQNTFSWKNLSLSFFLYFQSGAVKYWSDKTILIGQAADNNLLTEIYKSYWKKPVDKTWVPLPMYDGVYPGNPRKYDNNSDPGMSLIYEKTDFIKLKNINLSYSLPKKWLNRIRIEGASVFFNAYNVFTATSYGGYDPESTGNDRGLYPQSKSYSIGVKLNF